MTEQSPALTYTSYLALDEVLSAQRPRSDEHDEMLFIVIHQVYELWFKQLLHELDHLQQMLEKVDTAHSLRTLRRALTILKVVVAQIDVLETMTPRQFTSFRTRLDAASGFQSGQFRELEAVLGRRDERMLAPYPKDGVAYERITAAMSRRSLFDSFLQLPRRQRLRHPGRVPQPRPARGVDAGRGRAAGAGAGVRRRRRTVHCGRSARRPRRGHAGVALPAREDGRADHRREGGHRRLGRRRVPAHDACSAPCSPTCGPCGASCDHPRRPAPRPQRAGHALRPLRRRRPAAADRPLAPGLAGRRAARADRGVHRRGRRRRRQVGAGVREGRPGTRGVSCAARRVRTPTSRWPGPRTTSSSASCPAWTSGAGRAW